MRSGWRELPLENEELRVVVLPDRGAEIVELRHRRSGIDPLFHAPWGLAPPGSPAREGSDGHAFLEVYAGGWQELFPSVNDPCTYRGRPIPFHGEVATLPWECEREGASLRCSVHCRETPFFLERSMRLDGASLVLEERVRNESGEAAHFVWGHHCVLGPPFLESGCRLRVPAGAVETIPEMWEETARLEPGQRESWPHARLRQGGTTDLTSVPGPDEESHDDVYVTDLEAGWAAVENPRLGLTFKLEWDPAVFHWLISWQPYGGARAMPLAGSYALGVEPWVSRLNLEQAVAADEALELEPGGELTTTLRAEIQESTS